MQMPELDEKWRIQIEEAIHAVRNEEKKRGERYSNDEAVIRVTAYLQERFVERIGDGLDENTTALVDAELYKVFHWIIGQYVLPRLSDLRTQKMAAALASVPGSSLRCD
jgi:hypothetical protein